MAPNNDFHGEYLLESDEGSPLPLIDFGDSDTLHFLDTTRQGGQKGQEVYPTPNISHLAIPQSGISPQSQQTFQDSLSDSSSSKRTGSSFSTKSPFTGGDVTMSDGPESRDELKMEDWIQDADEDFTTEAGDGTINPSAIEAGYIFGTQSTNHKHEPTSASNSPSPFHNGMHSRLSPEASLSPVGHGSNFSSPYSQRDTRGHNKAHSVSSSLVRF